jgi:glyoxylate reductase
MAKPRIFVSRRVPDGVLSELRDSFEVGYHDSEGPLAREQLLEYVAGVDGCVLTLSDRADHELFDAAGPDLRIAANYAVGFDNLDVQAATERGVVVTNTPDVLTDATAEFAISLALSAMRRVAEGDRFLRARHSWSWAPTMMLGNSPRGRTLGVVGFGRIGQEVARLGSCLGMRVIFTDPVERDVPGSEQVSLAELLERSDVVSLHCPLLPETHHLIGEEELRAMKPSAYLVNTSRGPVVDEAALEQALSIGEIAGAALDVFENEPNISAGLLELDNVVLAPHLASATLSTREEMGRLCLRALRTVLLEGGIPPNALNAKAQWIKRD